MPGPLATQPAASSHSSCPTQAKSSRYYIKPKANIQVDMTSNNDLSRPVWYHVNHVLPIGRERRFTCNKKGSCRLITSCLSNLEQDQKLRRAKMCSKDFEKNVNCLVLFTLSHASRHFADFPASKFDPD